MQEKQFLKAIMERDLREAIHWQQIRPYYQPIIDLQTGAVIGFEPWHVGKSCQASSCLPRTSSHWPRRWA
jgi:predicted signal transduction protein with EAL and GGDEF domain